MKNALKTQLFKMIKSTASERNMSQRDLGKALQVSQPRISNLLDERQDLFSIDKLLEFVDTLGYHVEIKAVEKETVQ
ncbi:HTH DNA binding protein [Pectobacterium phage vB_PcaM_CBB]|uniref:Transcriptional regulator n=1 Tax=Pectobacterium phage vB_PcaM_CBB TaxID=2772511 RepID=A0A1L2CVM7_9CAUD|nr:HTH DNA binding protein [Pectobacterium phage vB_PcaM_CBB]AMM44074.1 transcriptional regulator [Pectobacterium phage vB_PcaM_CBB]